ncbi:MAG: anti-sigma factor [Methylacidiphilales bacterium]|nr:anti-sigma factor [Candidatus Methylacidiphilales bacterium]
MECKEVSPLLNAYLDGELDLTTCVSLEAHLAACPACRQRIEAGQAIAAAVREQAPRFSASPYLATRIRASLREAESPHGNMTGWKALPIAWIYSALAGVLGIIIFAAAFLSPVTESSPLIQVAMADHIRSLQVGHLMDVISTDQHTVKPWFMGRLDYSPQVVDLGPSGFPLVGGRLDVLDHRQVAAIVYQRRKHDINLFIWPETGTRLPTTLITHNGYHFVGWTQSGMNYLAVSDLAEGELGDFVKLIREQTN